jgi:hypothetical protein
LQERITIINNELSLQEINIKELGSLREISLDFHHDGFKLLRRETDRFSIKSDVYVRTVTAFSFPEMFHFACL